MIDEEDELDDDLAIVDDFVEHARENVFRERRNFDLRGQSFAFLSENKFVMQGKTSVAAAD
jgi:hypothetical protein